MSLSFVKDLEANDYEYVDLEILKKMVDDCIRGTNKDSCDLRSTHKFELVARCVRGAHLGRTFILHLVGYTIFIDKSAIYIDLFHNLETYGSSTSFFTYTSYHHMTEALQRGLVQHSIAMHALV
ncbi:hypothetical protein CR513_15457, partial [Mucuna pruriens]